MPTLKRGQTSTTTQLDIFLSKDGLLYDPYSINFSLYECISDVNGVLIGQAERIPVKVDVGKYAGIWSVPNDEPLGNHKIVWRIKETETSGWVSKVEHFDVVADSVITSGTYSDNINALITRLRIHLRDNNPDKYYKFQPPNSEETIAGFTELKGFIWSDEELYAFLDDSTEYINLIPPATGFIITDFPAVWRPILMSQAMVFSLLAEAIRWVGESFDYSLNGISLTINKQSDYQGLADAIQNTVDTQIEKAKLRVNYICSFVPSRYTFSPGNFGLGPNVSGTGNARAWFNAHNTGGNYFA